MPGGEEHQTDVGVRCSFPEHEKRFSGRKRRIVLPKNLPGARLILVPVIVSVFASSFASSFASILAAVAVMHPAAVVPSSATPSALIVTISIILPVLAPVPARVLASIVAPGLVVLHGRGCCGAAIYVQREGKLPEAEGKQERQHYASFLEHKFLLLIPCGHSQGADQGMSLLYTGRRTKRQG